VLTIEWRDDDHILMTGAAAFEHEGTLSIDGESVVIDVEPAIARRA
jgi:hypothetical protein